MEKFDVILPLLWKIVDQKKYDVSLSCCKGVINIKLKGWFRTRQIESSDVSELISKLSSLIA